MHTTYTVEDPSTAPVDDAPDVVVTLDETEAARAIYLEIDPEIHKVLSPTVWPWLEGMRRASNLPNLFVYHHRMTGRFVLCNWVYPPWEVSRPIAMELEGFSDPGDGWWPADLMPAAVLLARLQPMGDLQAKYQRRERDRQDVDRRRKEELVEARAMVCHGLKRAGMSEQIPLINNGSIPVELPSAETRELVNART